MWKQDLVNAQVEINRAVFLMNVHFMGSGHYKEHLIGKSLEPSIVLKHINLAIKDLQKAKEGLNEHLEASCKKPVSNILRIRGIR